MKYATRLLVFCLFIFLVGTPTHTYASHIVGGEMTYVCLGNNQYEVLLTIFRDCENGNPGAYFDNPAYVGVFDAASGAYLRTENFLFSGVDDTLDLSLSNPCFAIPPNVCIHRTTYRKIISLPFRAGGYHLAYQRCCRNNIIDNIVDPANTGATYDVVISPAALQNCNSSPRFREWPPFYICQGSPIDYDNSAFDLDGDSLAYELCSPSIGATPGFPVPQQPSSPPYTSVTWLPPFSLNNMLGGTDPLRIDPVTGRLSGTPANLGTFVVGFCVREYRNGVLIGVTKRDFQYSTGICGRLVTAQFSAPQDPCNISLDQFFLNSSSGDITDYQWDFGDGSPNVTSTSPVHTYPDTGTYNVTLIANPNSPCTDTLTQPVNINLNGVSIVPMNIVACEGDTVQLMAQNSLPSYNTFLTYNWAPAGNVLSGQGTSTIQVVANNNLNMVVSVSNDKGCTDSEIFPIQLEFVEAGFDSVTFECNTTLDVPFNNTSSTTNSGFIWNFGGTGTSTAATPTHTFPDTGRYTISLVAGIGATCQDTFEREIYVPLTGVDLQTSPIQACRGEEATLTVQDRLAAYNNITSYVWSPSNGIIAGQGTDAITINADVDATYTVRVVNDEGCEDSISTTVSVLQIDANFDTIDLQCNKTLSIPFTNTSVDPSVNFLWDFGGTGTSTDLSPTHTFPDSGTYLIRLIGGIGTVCEDTMEQLVNIPLDGAEISASDTQLVCIGDTVLLTANNEFAAFNTIIDYNWTPDPNILTGQGTDSVDVLATADINFMVVGLNDRGCRDTAFAYVDVTTISPPLDIVAIPDSIFVGQSSQLLATDSINYTYEWQPDTTLSAYDIFNPVARPRQTTTYYLTVSNLLCSRDDSVIVFIKAPICDNPVVFVPNAFSPNNDGRNDVLMVNGNNITEMTMAIYNRWGQKVFETNDQNIGWDGTFRGATLPPDVYGYYMSCSCEGGGRLFLKGNITLLR